MNATVHQFHFTPGTLIAYDGFQVVVTGAVKGGIVVRDRFIGEDEIVKHFVLSDARVNELLQRLDVHFDSEFSSDDPDQAEPQDEQVAFENRPRDELERAYQKEAFCLAAKSVLKRGPFFPGLITKNLTEITTLALDRQKLNGLGTTKNGAFVARTSGRSINQQFLQPLLRDADPASEGAARQDTYEEDEKAAHGGSMLVARQMLRCLSQLGATQRRIHCSLCKSTLPQS